MTAYGTVRGELIEDPILLGSAVLPSILGILRLQLLFSGSMPEE
jgi:hypothetical protein